MNRAGQGKRRTWGLAKLIEEAMIRPPHRPRTRHEHVADEYADLAAHAGDMNSRHENKVIAGELRRQQRNGTVTG